MAKAIRLQDGSYAALLPDGSKVPIPQNLVGEIVLPMEQVLTSEQGVTAAQRLQFKNLPNSPTIGRQYLEDIGYETRTLPPDAGPWNFAVRKTASDPWRVVDPLGMDLQDFTDLLGDVVSGVATGAGAALGGLGGPVGAFLGAGAASAGAEYGREALGQAAGMQQQIDPSQVAMAGALGAASVPAGAIAGKVAGAVGRSVTRNIRRAGRVGNEFAARMANVRSAGGMSAGEVNVARALEPEAIMQRLPSVDVNAKRFLTIISRLNRGVQEGGKYAFKEKNAEMAALHAAGTAQQPVTVNLVPAFEEVLSAIRKTADVTKTTSRRVLTETEFAQAQRATRVVKEGLPTPGSATVPGGIIRGRTAASTREATSAGSRALDATTSRTTTEAMELPLSGVAGQRAATRPAFPGEMQTFLEGVQRDVLGDFPLTEVPVHLADTVRKVAFDHAYELSAIDAVTGRSTRSLTGQVLDRVGGKVRDSVVDAMGGPQSPFGINHSLLAAKTKSFQAVKSQMGWGLEAPKAEMRTVNFLKALDADTHAGFLAYVNDIERQFGLPTDLLGRLIRRTAIAQSYGFQGGAEIIGPITAMGGLRGPSIVGAGVVGGMAGSVPGAIIGAAGAAILGSPVTLMGLTRAGLKVGSALTGMEAKLSTLAMTPEARAAGITAIRAAGGVMVDSAIARERAPRRKRVYIGQF